MHNKQYEHELAEFLTAHLHIMHMCTLQAHMRTLQIYYYVPKYK
jgi:hypothetical protein